jgi:hypothetical protein
LEIDAEAEAAEEGAVRHRMPGTRQVNRAGQLWKREASVIRLESNTAAAIAKLERDAKWLVKVMGPTGTVPGPVNAGGVGSALHRLQNAEEGAVQPVV